MGLEIVIRLGPVDRSNPLKKSDCKEIELHRLQRIGSGLKLKRIRVGYAIGLLGCNGFRSDEDDEVSINEGYWGQIAVAREADREVDDEVGR